MTVCYQKTVTAELTVTVESKKPLTYVLDGFFVDAVNKVIEDNVIGEYYSDFKIVDCNCKLSSPEMSDNPLTRIESKIDKLLDLVK